MRNWVHVWGTVVCMYVELGACLGNVCLHVCGLGCMSTELGAFLRNWVHVCGIGCMSRRRLLACMQNWVHVCGVGRMSGERLFACMRNWVHVCRVGCMSGEWSLACLRSWVLVWEQGAFPSSQAGPGPGPCAPHLPPTTLVPPKPKPSRPGPAYRGLGPCLSSRQ